MTPASQPRSRLPRIRAAVLAAAVLFSAAAAAAPAPAAAADPQVPAVTASSQPPACAITDVTTRFTSLADWSRTLLDWRLRVTAAYAPATVPLSRAGFTGAAGGGMRMRSLPAMTADLAAMRKAAAAAKAPVAVASAYRSFSTQRSTFAYWVRVGGYAGAVRASARAGHSEHQLGTTFDFKSAGGAVPWNYADWAKTTSGKWMAANAWRYGFVMSYPKGKTALTCYNYEPWHYRYFGRTIAAAIHASGQAPRVWLWQHGQGG